MALCVQLAKAATHAGDISILEDVKMTLESVLRTQENLSLLDPKYHDLELLHLACAQETSGALEFLTYWEEIDLNVKSNTVDGLSPLHCTMLKGSRAVFEFLLKRKVDLSVRNSMHQTLLHFVLSRGTTNIACFPSMGPCLEMFINSIQADKAILNATDLQGKTALDLAQEMGEAGEMWEKLLLGHSCKISTLRQVNKFLLMRLRAIQTDLSIGYHRQSSTSSGKWECFRVS
jgi:ankyrin repeat protein